MCRPTQCFSNPLRAPKTDPFVSHKSMSGGVSGVDATAAGGPTSPPTSEEKVRIGPEEYAYIYTRTSMVVAGRPVYRCSRGRDLDPGRLILYYSLDRWVAEVYVGDLTTVADVQRGGAPAFRAQPGADVLLSGWHEWECHKEGDEWWPASAFETTVL
jgi:hypothetical protein